MSRNAVTHIKFLDYFCEILEMHFNIFEEDLAPAHATAEYRPFQLFPIFCHYYNRSSSQCKIIIEKPKPANTKANFKSKSFLSWNYLFIFSTMQI